MTDLRKAAEMMAYEVPLHELLEGVPEDARLVIDSEDGMSTRFIPVGHLCKRAAEALRQALAQPVDAVNMSQERVDEMAKGKHEPVAWHEPGAFGNVTTHKQWALENGWQPLYTAPPKREWVGLTDDEIQETGRYSYCRGGISEKLYYIMWNSQPPASVGWCRDELIAFTRAIEAKLKEKNA